jgi:hypothetical protein
MTFLGVGVFGASLAGDDVIIRASLLFVKLTGYSPRGNSNHGNQGDLP